MVTVEGLNLDSALQLKDAEWVARQGEKFYVSLGFPELPKSFWEKSSLYPVPKMPVIKEHPRFRLAHGPGKRCSVAHEYRAECRMVRDGAS